MGAGASSSVKTIRIPNLEQSGASIGGAVINEKPKERVSSGRNSHFRNSFPSLKNEDSTDEEVTDLKKQLALLESEKLDLLDRITLLEGQLEQLDTQQRLANQEASCEETLHAKDQYIHKLEQETASAQGEVVKLRIKLKKKVRSLSTRIAEVKQEFSIQLLELRDEINRLTEENLHLHEKLRICETPRLDDTSLRPKTLDSGRSKLVLELSGQLNEQNERIEELEKSLVDRDKTIKDLQTSQQESERRSQIFKNKHSSGLTMRQGSPLTVTNEQDHKLEDLQKSQHKSEQTSQINTDKHSKGLESQDSDMAELQSVLSEMRNLRKQAKSRRTDDKHRGSSGQSRDSGLGSPGQPQSQSEDRTDRPGSASSSLSAMSNSSQLSEHHKVHSAPVRSVRGKPPPSRATKNSTHRQADTEPRGRSLSATRKKKFALQQRMDTSSDEEKKANRKLNSFVDSDDCDMESELLLESFRQDPVFGVETYQLS